MMLIGLLGACTADQDPVVKFRIENRTDYLLVVVINGSDGDVLSPHESGVMPGAMPGGDSIMVEAIEFRDMRISDDGRYFRSDGARVDGSRSANMVACRMYTWTELEAVGFSLAVIDPSPHTGDLEPNEIGYPAC